MTKALTGQLEEALETLEAVQREYGIAIAAAEARRNIVTRSVPLNHLVGQPFTIGEVRVRGIRLCDPCLYLARLLGDERIHGALAHRGGLRCEILTNGSIRVGDRIAPSEA